jgi:RNA polymerase sigma-70 factor (ECF subfamily)
MLDRRCGCSEPTWSQERIELCTSFWLSSTRLPERLAEAGQRSEVKGETSMKAVVAPHCQIRAQLPSAVPQEPLNYEMALRECAAGRRASLAKVYARERSRLCAVAHRIVRDRDHAEDVIHEAFAQILRDARDFDTARGSARAWIHAIVRNTALKARQSAAREVTLEEDKLVSICDRQQQRAQELPPVAESAELQLCLEQLEPRRRASLMLAIIDGHTHAEIARYLGVPIGTVKAWIRRELIALRAKLT